MIPIISAQTEDGDWEAHTEQSPYMMVSANTQAIAVGIVERALVWYAERTVKIRYEEMTRELNEVILIPVRETEPETVTVSTKLPI